MTLTQGLDEKNLSDPPNATGGAENCVGSFETIDDKYCDSGKRESLFLN